MQFAAETAGKAICTVQLDRPALKTKKCTVQLDRPALKMKICTVQLAHYAPGTKICIEKLAHPAPGTKICTIQRSSVLELLKLGGDFGAVDGAGGGDLQVLLEGNYGVGAPARGNLCESEAVERFR